MKNKNEAKYKKHTHMKQMSNVISEADFCHCAIQSLT